MTLFPTDIDECSLGRDDCNESARCDDTDGSFDCTCNPGYSGDGVNCEGIGMTLAFPYGFFTNSKVKRLIRQQSPCM